MTTHCKWMDGNPIFYNGYEHTLAVAPVTFYDDFLGSQLNKYGASTQTGAVWTAEITASTSTTIDLLADTPLGIAAITLDSADKAAVGALYFGDQKCFSLKENLVFETRMCFHTLPTTASSETVQAVWGLASSHNATLDSIATNVWFRVESGAQTTLLWESDDGNTDDDDNSASTTLVADTYHIYRIDCRDLANGVKFYVDNTLVGTTADFNTNLTASEAKVQPYFNVSKAKVAGNKGTGTMYVDYVRVWQDRS